MAAAAAAAMVAAVEGLPAVDQTSEDLYKKESTPLIRHAKR